MKYVVVSRHPAAVEFLRRQGEELADAPVLASANTDELAGKVVAGNVPLHLAAAAKAVLAVEFTGPAPRGQEYSLADMEQAGVVLRAYQVRRLREVGMYYDPSSPMSPQPYELRAALEGTGAVMLTRPHRGFTISLFLPERAEA